MSESVTKPPAIRRQRLQRQRSLAKTGMAAAMGALVLTGYLRGHKARLAHVVAGVALLGLSYWHVTLYANDPARRTG
ncbi:hypothetical protein CU669_18920 [Paramagnetospirillum kuznetsovii]|uniref:Uncharacterized protein n=1 Tax=Paramagnetospirillum kuznetsovii TaxID=2053833 RepID=A0A364NTB2_9PROT|nr:hypothetical protein [Paramagnetospirillum kuznetsovii]RAU20321.1 hypothetical protein CU669_18920 [Paramagnetospirillum kuznetsovii]